MRSKFEAWIPKLGYEVDPTQPAWSSTGNQVLLHIQMRSDAGNSLAPKFEVHRGAKTCKLCNLFTQVYTVCSW